ncbi:MAG: hypothetical protein SGARI_003411 [Bacillariaceae sp.]
MAYLEASVKTLLFNNKDAHGAGKGDDEKTSSRKKRSNNHLPVELPASICMIGMAVYGYTQDQHQPLAIVAAIVLHGFWDMAKHTCGVAVALEGGGE